MHIKCRFVEFARGQALLGIPRKLTRVVLFVFRSVYVLSIANTVAQRTDLLVFYFIPVFETVKSGILTYSPRANLFLDNIFIWRVEARSWPLRGDVGQRWTLKNRVGKCMRLFGGRVQSFEDHIRN